MSDPYKTGDKIHRVAIESFPNRPLPDENRGSWYNPCVEPRHESLVRSLMGRFSLERVYDLGAGDLRLSAALADDYDVVAYETNELLANYAYKEHGEPDIELRTRDYYNHWASMYDRDALFVAIGRTNQLPGTPRNGLGLEGVDDLDLTFGLSYRGES